MICFAPADVVPNRRLLVGELRRHPRPLLALAGWVLLEALPMVLSGQLIARALDDGFLDGLAWQGLGYLVTFAVVHIIAALAVRRCYPTAGTVADGLRDALLERVVDGALREAAAVGGLRAPHAAVSRMVLQVEVVRDVTAGLLLALPRVALTMVATMVGLLTLTPELVMLVTPPLALSLVIFICLVAALARHQRAAFLAEEGVVEVATPVLVGLRDVAALGAERHASATVGTQIDRAYAAATALARASALRVLVITLGVHLPIVLVLLLGPSLVFGGISVGVLIGAVTYLVMGLQPALQMLVRTVAGAGLRLSVTLQRLAETSTNPPPAIESPPRRPRGGGIELTGVRFTYGGPEPIVDELTLTVADGDHLAIVGPSGIGKSTLANLVAGLQRPQAGQIRLGGVPIERLRPGTGVALIPQEAYVFTGTLAENLTYLNPMATPADLDHAVETLGLEPLRARLGGYHAKLRPTTLSAAERQLVALARVYLSPARTVVLDEATSHLDPILEARTETAFADRDGTLVVIAHRMSSALRARRILLVDGSHPHLGTHDDLLAASPLYRDLMRYWKAGDKTARSQVYPLGVG
jgi:ATP-binding cassette, subfamily C, bacterial